MNIVVCAKQVPDPNIEPKMSAGRLDRSGPVVLDPGDEFAVEAALQLVEQHGGEVTVLTMGPDRAIEAVRKALSMGAHKAILITDPALEGADALLTARVLAAAIARQQFDLVIAGVESTDGYTGTVPATVAALLDVAQTTFARKLEIDGDALKIERQTVDGYDVITTTLPAVITVTAGVNEPRYPSFKGIVGAKSKPVEQLTAADLGVDPAASQSVVDVQQAAQRGAGEIVTDESEAVAKIVDFLTNAKVI